jgi:hypothetical protein
MKRKLAPDGRRIPLNKYIWCPKYKFWCHVYLTVTKPDRYDGCKKCKEWVKAIPGKRRSK